MGATTMPELVRLMVGRDLADQFPKQTAPVGDEALRVEGLCRAGVLHDISFTLRRGEVIGLAGLMGSGRTELARAIFGAARIDRGRIFVGGQERKIGSPRAAIDLGLGFLTEDRQHQSLILGLSVQENTCLPSVDGFSRFGVMRPAQESAATGPASPS